MALALLGHSSEALLFFAVGVALLSWQLPRCSRCGRSGALVESNPYVCLWCAE